MAQLLVVSNTLTQGAASQQTLPVLTLLPHDIQFVLADTQALTDSARADLVLLDGRLDLAGARMMARLFASSGSTVPILLVLAENGLTAVSADWGLSDSVIETAGIAEFEARIRLLVTSAANDGLISSGGIVIDDGAYSAVKDGEPLDLTYTEFELLKYLVQH
ncbi:MAG: DNA-binding response regulator, partial [Propionicimonas sp.]